MSTKKTQADKGRREQVKAEVKEKLEGLEFRQDMRDAARLMLSRAQAIHKLRRERKLDRRDEARAILTEKGLYAMEEERYGIVIIHTCAAVMIAYDREGNISWNARPRLAKNFVSPQVVMDFSYDGDSDDDEVLIPFLLDAPD